MLDFITIGDEPIPGYKIMQDLGGSVFYRLFRVQTPEGLQRVWKAIDLNVGNAAVETRNLKLLVTIRHPFLNTLTNFYNLEDGKVLVVESEVPVKSLQERLDECMKTASSAIPPKELYSYMQHAATGLDFLNQSQHELDGKTVAIYHRDLRPESLLLFKEGEKTICKVSDFGLAKPVTEEVAAHSQGLVHYDYDPPEFYEGETAPTSDQYSLAINYYKLRTGDLPFHGTMLEQLQARLQDNPQLGRVTEPERRVVKRALSRDPKKRFGSCTEFVKELAIAFQQMSASTSGVQQKPSASGVGSVNRATADSVRPRSAPASARDLMRQQDSAVASRASVGEDLEAPGAGGNLPGVVRNTRPMPTRPEPMLNSANIASDHEPMMASDNYGMNETAVGGERTPSNQSRTNALRDLRQAQASQAPTPSVVEDEPQESKTIPVTQAVIIIFIVAVLTLILLSVISQPSVSPEEEARGIGTKLIDWCRHYFV